MLIAPALPPAARRWWHAPTHHDQLAAGVGIALDRGRVVREHARHRRQVADVAVDDAKQGNDRRLVGGDVVEITGGGLLYG